LKKPEIIDAHFTVVGAKAWNYRRLAWLLAAIGLGALLHPWADKFAHLIIR
jgi:hypothetical protein